MRKKIFTFLLALAASVGLMNAAPNDSGSCGANVTYSFDGATGAMTITGTGPMAIFESKSDAPWNSYRTSITSVTITDGVTSVSNNAFGQCTSLTTVTIGNDVETIGEWAFNDCGEQFTSLTLGNSIRTIGNYAFLFGTGITGFTLPSTLETIGDYAFCQNRAITTLTIPSNVTSIGKLAFYNCNALTSITTEATTPPTLKETVFDGVPTSIPLNVPNGSVAAYTAADQWNAFNIQGYDPAPGGGSTPANVCGDGLTWELNGGVLTISYDGEGTGEMTDFGYENDQNPVNVAPWKENKSEITTVIVGDGVKSIGNYAFNDLSENFKAVTIANSVERIGLSAFMNAKWITEITLPSSLKTIDRECFAANFGFTSITIPSGVTSIGYHAFGYCTGLTSLTCEATTPPTLASGVFYKITSKTSDMSSIPLYVPSGSVAAYEDAAQWNAFNIQGYDPAPTPTPAQGNDKLSGAFSVDGDKVVYFSKGNLQATTNDLGATWTWGFAANQYDYIGNAAANNAINGNGTVSTNGTVDLFGWSTSSTVYGIHNSNNTYTYSGDFVDWSSNTDLIASLGEGWRTLTSSEWGYLLDWRTGDKAATVNSVADCRYTKATINTDGTAVKGIILFPDGGTFAASEFTAVGSPNTEDANYTTTCTTAQWNALQTKGCVFLPAAGNRQGKNVSEEGSAGYYWSAISVDGNTADYMLFNDEELSASRFNSRHNGWSVRLVSETAPAPTPTPTPTDEQVPTNADPENPGTYYYSTFFHGTQNYALTNDGTQAFIATLSNNDLVLTEIANGTQVIPANTAVILRKTGSADPVALAPTDEEGVSFSAHNSLEGVDAETAVTSIDGLTTTNCYVLSGTNEHGVGFYRINSDKLKAHKAYVKYAGGPSGAPKRMRFIFNQEKVATGVENTDASAKIGGSEKVIENGQLIIIKNGVRYNAQGQIVK